MCLHLIRPDSQTSRCKCGRMSFAFRTGKYGKIMWMVSSVVVVGIGLEVTVQEQQRLVNHQKGEGKMVRYDKCAMNLFRHLSHACVTRMKMCEVCTECVRTRKVCVRQVSVCTPPVVHAVVVTTCVRNSQKKPVEKILVQNTFKILRLHRSMSVLRFLPGTCSISWLFINHCEWKFLGFPKHASLRDRPS